MTWPVQFASLSFLAVIPTLSQFALRRRWVVLVRAVWIGAVTTAVLAEVGRRRDGATASFRFGARSSRRSGPSNAQYAFGQRSSPGCEAGSDIGTAASAERRSVLESAIRLSPQGRPISPPVKAGFGKRCGGYTLAMPRRVDESSSGALSGVSVRLTDSRQRCSEMVGHLSPPLTGAFRRLTPTRSPIARTAG